MSRFEEITLKQYGPEREGENVAWVHVYPVLEGAAYLNIGAGIVGRDGASFSYSFDRENGQRAFSSNSVRGLRSSIHAEVLIRPSSNTPYTDEQEARGRPSVNGGHLLEALSRHTESDADFVWAEGSREIADAIKAELGKVGLDAYGYAYYAVNGLIGHNIKNDEDRSRLLIVDPEMAEATRGQLEALEGVLGGLEELEDCLDISIRALGFEYPLSTIAGILSGVRDNHEKAEQVTDRLRNELINKVLFTRSARFGRDWPYRNDQLPEPPGVGKNTHYYVEHAIQTNKYISEHLIPYIERTYSTFETLNAAETAN